MNKAITIMLGGTRGLGWELAKIIQEQGEETFIIGRSYNPMIHGAGMVADLSRLTDIEKVIKQIELLGKIRSFYWIAGVGHVGDFSEQENITEMVAVNFANVLPIIQLVWTKMLNQEEQASFVAVSSISGIKPRVNEAVYVASKHAQVGLVRSLGLESQRLHSPIRVSHFLPGGMQTEFWSRQKPEQFSEYLDPRKVANEISHDVLAQEDYFFERIIERGSL